MTRSATAESHCPLAGFTSAPHYHHRRRHHHRTLHCKSHHTHSARLLACNTAKALGVPVSPVPRMGQCLFDASGVCVGSELISCGAPAPFQPLC